MAQAIETTSNLSAVAKRNGITDMGGKWTMDRIDALPFGRKSVIVPKLNYNPKANGSQAWLIWAAYGTPDEPNHTVTSLFVTFCGETTTVRDAKGLRFTTSRVWADLRHGLENGLLTLQSPAETVEADEQSPAETIEADAIAPLPF